MNREQLAAKLNEIMREWWKGADYPLFNDDPTEGFLKIAEWLEANRTQTRREELLAEAAKAALVWLDHEAGGMSARATVYQMLGKALAAQDVPPVVLNLVTLSVYRIERITPPREHERKGWRWSWEVVAASPEAALAEIPEHHDGAQVVSVAPVEFPMVIHTGLSRPK